MTEEQNWVDASANAKLVRWTNEPSSKWEEENTFFIGVEVSGVYKSRKDGVGEHSSSVYELDNQEHGQIGIWGTTLLNELFKKIPFGHMVKVKYLGEQKVKVGNRTYKNFKVVYSKDPVVEMVDAGVDEEPIPEM